MDPLWASLLNSDWHDHRGSGAREDRIGNDLWLLRFLDRVGWGGSPLPDEPHRAELRRLRSLLRECIEAYRREGRLDPEQAAALSRLLEAAPVTRRMDGEGNLVVVPAAGSLPHVLGEVVASLAAMLVRREPSRVKICANPDCGWVMYDESRNQTRRWCSASDCGNLFKVRKHRLEKRIRRAAGS